MNATANLNAKLTMDDTVFSRAIRSAQGKISAFVGSTGRSLGRIAAYASVATLALSGLAALKSGFKDGIVGAANMEREETALTVLLGSIEKSKKLLGEVTKLADDTPYEFPEIAQATRMLVAYGYSSDNVVKELRKMGDVASGTGVELKDMAYLFGTTRTQGRLFGRDLIQFTTRGIPMTAALAKVMHVNVKEVDALVSAGKIGFPEVSKALNLMTQKGGQFYQMLQKQSLSALGLWSTLMDKLHGTERAFAFPLLERLKPIMSALIQMLSTSYEKAGKLGERVATGLEMAIGAVSHPMMLLEALAFRYGAQMIEGVLGFAKAAGAAFNWFAASWQGIVDKAADFGRNIFDTPIFAALSQTLLAIMGAAGAGLKAGFLMATFALYDGLLSAQAAANAAAIVGVNSLLNYFSQGWTKAVWNPIKAIGERFAEIAVDFGEALAAAVRLDFDAVKKAGDDMTKGGGAPSPVRVGGSTDFAKVFAEQKAGMKAGLGGVDKFFEGIKKTGEAEAAKAGDNLKDALGGLDHAGKIIKRGVADAVTQFDGAGGLAGSAGKMRSAADARFAALANAGRSSVAAMVPKTAAENAAGAYGKLGTFASFTGNSSLAVGNNRFGSGGLSTSGVEGLSGGASNRIRRGDRANRKAEEELKKADKTGAEKTNDLLSGTNQILREGLLGK